MSANQIGREAVDLRLVVHVAYLTVDRHGRTVDESNVLCGVELPWSGAEWIWHLSPRDAPDYSHVHRVRGIASLSAR